MAASARNNSKARRFRWRYLNSHLQNALKVIIGFIPAFLTFALTKDWWLLAYFGAFIWFGITGLRNIVQSVLGGGGFKRSPLLNWNDYISWTRITDSLLFTGFSVPLLDYLVKTLILDRVFGITTGSQPVLLYTFMALANGIYLSSHNILRGLPKGAVYGNFFRSILSIPIAIGFNMVIGAILGAAGVAGVNLVLQKWAAIISKAASDIVASIIEGLADRHKNIQARLREYTIKFAQLFDIYAQLELLYPEVQTFKILDYSTNTEPSGQCRSPRPGKNHHDPRAGSALLLDVPAALAHGPAPVFRHPDRRRTPDPGQQPVYAAAAPRNQPTAHRRHPGPQLSAPLSFYLSRYEGYLEEVKRLIFNAPPPDSVNTGEPGLRSDMYSPAPVKDACQARKRRVAN